MKGSPRPWSLNCEHLEDSILGTEATDDWMTHHSEGSAWSWEKGRSSPLLFSISSAFHSPFQGKPHFYLVRRRKRFFWGGFIHPSFSLLNNLDLFWNPMSVRMTWPVSPLHNEFWKILPLSHHHTTQPLGACSLLSWIVPGEGGKCAHVCPCSIVP